MPGSHFDPSALKSREITDNWVQIPAWFAGQFASRFHTQVSKISLSTGEQLLAKPRVMPNRRTDRHGMQMDARGGIWHFIRVPFSTEVPFGDCTNYQFVTSQDYAVAGEDDVIIHYLGIQSFVSPSGQTLDSVQVETIQEYRRAKNDQLQCTASLKEFDAKGHPTTLTKEVWTEERISPFQSVDRSHHGVDLRRSFADFLISHDLRELLPVDAGAMMTEDGHLPLPAAGF